MEALSLEKMESLVGGSDYCTNLLAILIGGNYQGTDAQYLQAWVYYAERCSENHP